MIPSSSGDPFATYTNIPNYILMYLFEQKRGDLSRTALKLYLYLRSMKNNNSGLAWPGVRKIVRDAHVSRDDVKPAREQLVAVGLISISPNKGPNGTIMIEFNDELIQERRSSIRGTPIVPPLGEHPVPPVGEQTITNTISTITNTTPVRKRKKKARVNPSPSPTPTIISPDATQIRPGAFPQWGNSTPVGARMMSTEELRQRDAEWEAKQKRFKN